jgi:hypothetical protein
MESFYKKEIIHTLMLTEQVMFDTCSLTADEATLYQTSTSPLDYIL